MQIVSQNGDTISFLWRVARNPQGVGCEPLQRERTAYHSHGGGHQQQAGSRENRDKVKDDSGITMLVNNAGFASVAPLLDADIEKMRTTKKRYR
jgi:hypothetical protein